MPNDLNGAEFRVGDYFVAGRVFSRSPGLKFGKVLQVTPLFIVATGPTCTHGRITFPERFLILPANWLPPGILNALKAAHV